MATQVLGQSGSSCFFASNTDMYDLSKAEIAAPQLFMLADIALTGELGGSSCCEYQCGEEKQMAELRTVRDASFSDSEGDSPVGSQRIVIDSEGIERVLMDISEKRIEEASVAPATSFAERVEEEQRMDTSDTTEISVEKNKYSKSKPFRCKPCQYVAGSEEEFVHHIKVHSAQKFIVEEDAEKQVQVIESEADAPKEADLSKGPIRCERCGYNTSRYDHYLAHLKHHNQVGESERVFSCPICTYTTVSEYHWKKHLRNHFPRKVYTCHECSYFSDRKNNYIQHIRTHTGERPYQCIVCNYQSSQKTHLTRHMRIHSGEKPFRCDQCSYVASNQHEVTRHARQLHNGPKPLKCPHCNYNTADRSNYKKHVELHVRPRQFMCPVCHYAASKKCNLQYHIKSRHFNCSFITMDISRVKLRTKKNDASLADSESSNNAGKEQVEEQEGDCENTSAEPVQPDENENGLKTTEQSKPETCGQKATNRSRKSAAKSQDSTIEKVVKEKKEKPLKTRSAKKKAAAESVSSKLDKQTAEAELSKKGQQQKADVQSISKKGALQKAAAPCVLTKGERQKAEGKSVSTKGEKRKAETECVSRVENKENAEGMPSSKKDESGGPPVAKKKKKLEEKTQNIPKDQKKKKKSKVSKKEKSALKKSKKKGLKNNQKKKNTTTVQSKKTVVPEKPCAARKAKICTSGLSSNQLQDSELAEVTLLLGSRCTLVDNVDKGIQCQMSGQLLDDGDNSENKHVKLQLNRETIAQYDGETNQQEVGSTPLTVATDCSQEQSIGVQMEEEFCIELTCIELTHPCSDPCDQLKDQPDFQQYEGGSNMSTEQHDEVPEIHKVQHRKDVEMHSEQQMDNAEVTACQPDDGKHLNSPYKGQNAETTACHQSENVQIPTVLQNFSSEVDQELQKGDSKTCAVLQNLDSEACTELQNTEPQICDSEKDVAERCIEMRNNASEMCIGLHKGNSEMPPSHPKYITEQQIEPPKDKEMHTEEPKDTETHSDSQQPDIEIVAELHNLSKQREDAEEDGGQQIVLAERLEGGPEQSTDLGDDLSKGVTLELVLPEKADKDVVILPVPASSKKRGNGSVDTEEDEGIHSHDGSDLSDNVSEGSDDSGLNCAPSAPEKTESKATAHSAAEKVTNELFVCIFCDRSFRREDEYSKHLNRHLVNVYYLEKAAMGQE
ncbi:RE1-silencing transcription factor [Ambystoma mexicanum]|uniref:RE1-silencing transcription factor n=1 Tax=Ambystoma mexicanum TaxID=8296 RepID=UPI0037E72E3D